MRILIINSVSLSDIIRALPVLDYLRKVSSNAEVDWIVAEAFQEILEGQLMISNLLPVRTRFWQGNYHKPSTWRDLKQLKDTLSDRKYDIVFDFQGDRESGIFCWMTGCSRCCGFADTEITSRMNDRFVRNRIPMRRQDQHISERMLRVASVPFGKDYSCLALETDIHSESSDDAETRLFLATLADGLVFVLHLTADAPTKCWYEGGWIELGLQLTDLFPDLTLLLAIDNNVDREVCERVAAGIGRQTRILPKMSLSGYVSLIKKIDLLIGGDCWPVHAAAAVDTPTVSIWRVSDGRRFGPRGDQHRIMQSTLSCSGCGKTECQKDTECCRSIPVEAVCKGVRELLHIGEAF